MPGALQSSSTHTVPASVQEALARGATVLTPGQRAARTLRRRYDEDLQQFERASWPAPPIFALDAWLSSLWSGLLIAGEDERLLLNRSQEHQLWRTILSADTNLNGLASLDQLAALSADAWQRLALFGGRAQPQHHSSSPDTSAFAGWAAEFEQTCIRRRYLSASHLPVALNSALAAGVLDLSDAGIVLLDQIELAPAHEELFRSIELAGYPVVRLQSAVHRQTLHAYTASDDAAELRAATEWLHKRYVADPAARLALVVPQLGDRRSEIDRALADVFGASLLASATPAYEFSLGQPLSETSAAASALALLRWQLGPLSIDSISRLLLSPFFGATDPATVTAVAEFDAYELRDSHLLRPEMTLRDCARKMRTSRRAGKLLPLLSRMQAAAGRPLDAKSVQSPAHWADEFREVLALLGWTGATERDSLGHQLRKRLEGALDELATLDFDNALISSATALDRLTRIASETIFAPESRDASLQVLGPTEVLGTTFDALWFLGADDTNWPASASVNPLLPWSLQHVLRMPGADPDGDAAAGRLLTLRIADSAGEVVFSYAVNGEDQKRRPSAMLTELTLQPLDVIVSEDQPALSLETADDSEPLPPLPDRVLRGGAHLLELQAACSFRAFAELRLNSNQPQELEHGFDARESGNILHQVMQHFWNKHTSQANLRALSRPERDQSLRESIASALEQTEIRDRSTWDNSYLRVQRRRIFNLLNPWLEIELKRPRFKVLELEQKVADVAIGPLRLNLRLDRVDETSGGNLIIDYKSGDGARKQWEGDRPDKPQLPLYGVLTQGKGLGGIAFAILRAGKKTRIEGLAASSEVLAGKPMQIPMSEQLEQWQQVLEALAHEFADGTTQTSPKHFPKTCETCGQRLLCRLDRSTQHLDEEAAHDEEEDVIHG